MVVVRVVVVGVEEDCVTLYIRLSQLLSQGSVAQPIGTSEILVVFPLDTQSLMFLAFINFS